MQLDKPLFPKMPPVNPEKRAKSIRDAINKGKIKRTNEINDILGLLDQLVALEKTA
jgi:hypothetical protein